MTDYRDRASNVRGRTRRRLNPRIQHGAATADATLESVRAEPSDGHILKPDELRRVFGAFPSGVTAIAAVVNGVPVGLAASSFTSVSLDPPLVSVCIAHTSTTWPELRDRPRLGVTVLGAQHETACRQLSAKHGDRFAGLDLRTTADGALFVEGGSAWLDCAVELVVSAGDHDIVLLRVQDLGADHSVAPLVFHASGFRQLVSRP